MIIAAGMVNIPKIAAKYAAESRVEPNLVLRRNERPGSIENAEQIKVPRADTAKEPMRSSVEITWKTAGETITNHLQWNLLTDTRGFQNLPKMRLIDVEFQ